MIKKLDLNTLLVSFNDYLDKLGKVNKYHYFGRDPIIAAMSDSCEAIIPPIKSLLSHEEFDKVNHCDTMNGLAFSKPDVYEIVDEEKVRLIEKFINYVMLKGYQEYIFYSENFYDITNVEEEKAFKLDVNQNFRNFISSEQVGMGCRDTIVFTEDFTKILIFFHHGFYELCNKEFAADFKRFIDYIEMSKNHDNVDYKINKYEVGLLKRFKRFIRNLVRWS